MEGTVLRARASAFRLVGIVALAALLSGCVAGDDDVDPEDDDVAAAPPEAQVSATTGAIDGSVASDLFEPLSGAIVTIVETGAETQVARNGRFTMNDVEPGRYTLHTSAIGYESSSRAVDVRAGEITPVNIVLTPLASDDPFIDEIEHSGKVTFALAWQAEVPTQGCVIIVSPVSGVVPDGKTCGGVRLGDGGERAINVTEDAKTFMAEMVWQPAGPLGEYLSLDLLCSDVPRGFGGAVQDTDHPCFFNTPSRTSPVIHRVDEAHWLEHGYAYAGDWAGRIFGTYGAAGTYDAAHIDFGVAYEQQFKVYFTVHHKEPAPEGYTAIPEA